MQTSKSHKRFGFVPKTIVATVTLVALAFIPLARTAHANVNDFPINSYDIMYDLSRTADGHSQLATTETIVATFPQSNQNHGIERAIPEKYNGHKTSLSVESVTDENGKDWRFTVRDETNFDVIRIGDPDQYVHGQKTFVIKYAQRDVTRFYQDTGKDEFYWDTNGTGWKQSIDRLSVTLNVDSALQDSFSGDSACYKGEQGSTDRCEITQQGNTFTASATNLKPGENITLALGFAPSTFVEYQPTLADRFFVVWGTAQAALVPITIVAIILMSVRYYRQSNRSRDQHTIIPEYTPPQDASIAVVAKLFSYAKSFPAQLIDLAVRHYIKIYEIESKSFFGSKKTDYKIEIIKSTDDLRDEEKEFVNDIFDNKATVGATLTLKDLKKDKKLRLRLSNNATKLTKLEREKYQLRAKATGDQNNWYKRVAIGAAVITVLTLSPVFSFVAVVAFVMSGTLWPLTDKGLALVRHIKGLRMYVKTAEQDRLRMLQSPEGAEKVPVDTADSTQMVKLYERALPYAMLFGQEKQWNKVLGKYYEQTGTSPDWYVGRAGFTSLSASSFASAMNSFSSSAVSSSSTGGSGGGGSSGGGGGGGGGGGW